MGWKDYAMRLLGILLLIGLLLSVDIASIWKELISIDPFLFLLVLLLLFPMMALRALRWRYALSRLGTDISRTEAITFHFASSFLGIITPGRIGEMVKVYYIKDRSKFSHSLVGVLADRVYDLAFLFVVAVPSIFLLPIPKGMLLAGLGLSAIGIVLSIVYLEDIISLFSKAISRMSRKEIPKQDLKKAWSRFTLPDYAVMLGYTLASYAIYYLLYYIGALSIGLTIGFIELSAALAITSIITFLPISFLGIGTRDISLVFLFGLLGIGTAQAIAYSTVILIISLAGALFGLVAWLNRPSG